MLKPMHSPRIPPEFATNQIKGIFWSLLRNRIRKGYLKEILPYFCDNWVLDIHIYQGQVVPAVPVDLVHQVNRWKCQHNCWKENNSERLVHLVYQTLFDHLLTCLLSRVQCLPGCVSWKHDWWLSIHWHRVLVTWCTGLGSSVLCPRIWIHHSYALVYWLQDRTQVFGPMWP